MWTCIYRLWWNGEVGYVNWCYDNNLHQRFADLFIGCQRLLVCGLIGWAWARGLKEQRQYCIYKFVMWLISRPTFHQDPSNFMCWARHIGIQHATYVTHSVQAVNALTGFIPFFRNKFPGLFQDFPRTQIDFSRVLKFTLTPTLLRSQC